jgi:hypothetical protein
VVGGRWGRTSPSPHIPPTTYHIEAVKKLDFVFLALVFSVTYRREKPDFSIFSQLHTGG